MSGAVISVLQLNRSFFNEGLRSQALKLLFHILWMFSCFICDFWGICNFRLFISYQFECVTELNHGVFYIFGGNLDLYLPGLRVLSFYVYDHCLVFVHWALHAPQYLWIVFLVALVRTVTLNCLWLTIFFAWHSVLRTDSLNISFHDLSSSVSAFGSWIHPSGLTGRDDWTKCVTSVPTQTVWECH